MDNLHNTNLNHKGTKITKKAMPEQPLVSLITPSYNQGAFLEQTIQSVLAQDYPNLEYILMDGGSSDNSVEIIQRYASRLSYWESQPDRGQAHAINKGLQRSHGSILGWLNSDDLLMMPDTVSRAVQVFQAEPDIAVVYGRLERINAQGEPVPTPLLPKDRVEFSREFAVGECVVNQPGSFWQRPIMEQVGWLDESLHYNLDYEYWMRMLLAGARFRRLPQVVARFRLSSGSKTVGQTAAMATEQLTVLEQFLAHPDLPDRLGLPPERIQRQARRARALIGLHAFYGSVKLQRWNAAGRWLAFVLHWDATALLQRRWFDLALAGLERRWRFFR